MGYIEWINESSANIVFKSKGSAKKALESLSYPKVGDAPWRRTPDILVNDDCPPIFLQMRLATTGDVKKGKKGVPSVFTRDSKVGPPRSRASQRAGEGNSVYRDGMTTELLEQAGLLGKRRKPEDKPSEEEIAKRQKRTSRFGSAEQADTGTSSTAVVAEDPQLELAKRQKRAERFSGSSDG